MLFKQLECFLVVARLGSMSRAAEEMYLTQPSLTARLKALEQEVGGALFVRTKYGMRLTEAGREFLPYAERCVGTIESGKQHLKELREGTTGHLKLGALPRVGTYTLPAFLEEFSSVYPRVLISVLTGHSKDVLNMVLTEEVQVGLARAMNHPDVENIPLYEEELVLVVSPKHRFAQRESVDLTELGREQLILFDRSSSNYDLTKSLFRDTGIQEPRTTELDNIEAAKRMVEHQLGVSFLPRPAISRAVTAGRLCTVEVSDCPRLQRSIVAIRRRDSQPTGAMAAFLKMVSRISETLDETPLPSS
jgi:DNA-binding transcriptional LysR family regulator